MSLNIITIGSKVLDDIAVVSKGKIINKHRIVEVNPICLFNTLKTYPSEEEIFNLYDSMTFFNSYAKYIFSIEFEGKIKSIIESLADNYVILYDFTALRRPIHVFLLDSGEKLYLTENQVLVENFDVIIKFIDEKIGSIQSDYVINMFNTENDLLKKAVNDFESLVTCNENVNSYFIDIRFLLM